VRREVEQFGDVVFVKEKTNYKSILYKTYHVLEYAIQHFDVRYILKTDDDAFINVAALAHQLRQLCQSEVRRSSYLHAASF
jgi:hydroxyproline O-galactosyltransferase 2/3/4/5/6